MHGGAPSFEQSCVNSSCAVRHLYLYIGWDFSVCGEAPVFVRTMAREFVVCGEAPVLVYWLGCQSVR